MKKVIIYLFWLALLVTGIYFGAGLYNKASYEQWPTFERTEGAPANAPDVVTLQARDFGWRIGDIVPAEFYIKQKPGTVVDVYSLSTEGDFTIVGVPEFEYKDFEDGTRYIHIRMNLQSMAVGDSLHLKSYMLYRDEETNEDHLFDLPVFETHTSKTWDGRDIVKEGDTSLNSLALVINTLLYVALGVIGATSLIFLNRHLKRKFFIAALPADFHSRKKIARKRFDAVYEKIVAGEFSEANFLEVALIIRELFHLQTAGYSEIASRLGEAHPFRKHVTKILLILGEPLYRNRNLTLAEVHEIKRTFDLIVPPQG
ncbi:MAG: hypothetical protein H6677_01670 [Candidatus Obscuribacterales bacterium]|nr:hypothetical protein [Cyanobacteria bacterium HKST-UBA01]MCB9466953.1 hypothetical protein [Candidatus Obscuribacterales bacterium]